jgi:hypothetical protein
MISFKIGVESTGGAVQRITFHKVANGEAACFVACLWLLAFYFSQASERVAATIAAAVACLFTAKVLALCVNTRPQLRVDAGGFTDEHSGVGSVPWSDVIVIRKSRTPSFIEFDLRNPEHYSKRIGTRARLGGNASLRNDVLTIRALALPVTDWQRWLDAIGAVAGVRVEY